MHEYLACKYICVPHVFLMPTKASRRHCLSWNGVSNSDHLPRVSLKSNPGLLKEQSVIFLLWRLLYSPICLALNLIFKQKSAIFSMYFPQIHCEKFNLKCNNS